VRLDPADARRRFADASVLRLATAGRDRQPHVVPCTFAVDDDGRVLIGIDDKPKRFAAQSSPNLRRLANIAVNPSVSLLVDHYAADWTQLWWARADGMAAVARAGEDHAAHWQRLVSKYPQYGGKVPGGPVIVVSVTAWSGWAFTSPTRYGGDNDQL
jgi:PPOX class probable F420-dependent enzyme